jgi:hypothetical protein
MSDDTTRLDEIRERHAEWREAYGGASQDRLHDIGVPLIQEDIPFLLAHSAALASQMAERDEEIGRLRTERLLWKLRAYDRRLDGTPISFLTAEELEHTVELEGRGLVRQGPGYVDLTHEGRAALKAKR